MTTERCKLTDVYEIIKGAPKAISRSKAKALAKEYSEEPVDGPEGDTLEVKTKYITTLDKGPDGEYLGTATVKTVVDVPDEEKELPMSMAQEFNEKGEVVTIKAATEPSEVTDIPLPPQPFREKASEKVIHIYYPKGGKLVEMQSGNNQDNLIDGITECLKQNLGDLCLVMDSLRTAHTIIEGESPIESAKVFSTGLRDFPTLQGYTYTFDNNIQSIQKPYIVIQQKADQDLIAPTETVKITDEDSYREAKEEAPKRGYVRENTLEWQKGVCCGFLGGQWYSVNRHNCWGVIDSTLVDEVTEEPQEEKVEPVFGYTATEFTEEGTQAAGSILADTRDVHAREENMGNAAEQTYRDLMKTLGVDYEAVEQLCMDMYPKPTTPTEIVIATLGALNLTDPLDKFLKAGRPKTGLCRL